MSALPQFPAKPRGRSRRLLVFLGFTVSAIAGIVGGILFVSLADMPDISDLTRFTPSPATKLYDSAEPAELIAQMSIEQRTFVPLARMPRALLDASVAIEDERFYSHWGLDLWGIARATLVNLFHGRVVEGASTITQQLARTLFLTMERTFQRKIKEALLAIQIERQYKKEEILEMYLNQIYFGNGAYGAEQGARVYFGKHVEELTLPECALLAALPKAPNVYNPRAFPDKALSRRNLVLQRMAQNGFISRGESAESQNSAISLRQTEITNAPYFAAYVRQHLETSYGSQAIMRGGLSVHSTLNLRYQSIAQRALEQGLQAAEALMASSHRGSLSQGMNLQGALVALDPRTGAILAMVGGRSFKENEFNRATQAKRQPGSSFKPFIYTTGLLNGWTASDLIDDSKPQQYAGKGGKGWTPSNFERQFFGPTSLRKALAFSRNIVTVKLLNQVGVLTVVGQAKKFGFSGPFRDDLTLALGTSEVGLLEMVSAFSVFANGGVRAVPYAVKLVKDSQGNILEQHRQDMAQVVSPQVAYVMLSMLRDTVDYGTAKVVRRLGFKQPAAGKTGSTNDFTDAWFVGLTPNLACGIWIGFDDRRSMGKNMTGGLIAAPIWTAFMSEALERATWQDFEKPEGLVTVSIDRTTGLLSGKDCRKEQVINEIFVEGTQPTRVCDKHFPAGGGSFANADMEQMEALQGDSGTSKTITGKQQAPVTPEDSSGQETGY